MGFHPHLITHCELDQDGRSTLSVRSSVVVTRNSEPIAMVPTIDCHASCAVQVCTPQSCKESGQYHSHDLIACFHVSGKLIAAVL